MAAATHFDNLHVLIFTVVMLFLQASTARIITDTLSYPGNITDGETLVSSGGTFTLGFFSPMAWPEKRYLGIWFTASADAVCWVANRDAPLINTTTGVLAISSAGILRLLLDGSAGLQTAWSSNATGGAVSPAVAQLLESGNLVVRAQQGSGDTTLWQSFDYPSNTLLAGMRLGKNPQTGAEWSLTSWRVTPNDPTTGDYRLVMDGTKGLPDCVSWQGGVKRYRTGPWNGLWFSGVPNVSPYSQMFPSQVVIRPDEVFYTFNATAGAPFSRLVLNEAGVLQGLAWDPDSRSWGVFSQARRDGCDEYAACGAFGLCNVDTASALSCSCLEGFSPVAPLQWALKESSGGCRRNVPLECDNGTTTDGFLLVRSVKLPDTDNATVDVTASLEQCKARCLANCSCVAFAAADIDYTGCIMWTTDLVDVRHVDKGQYLYLRLAQSHLVQEKNKLLKILIPIIACPLLLAFTALLWICKNRGKRQKKKVQKRMMQEYFTDNAGKKSLEFPFFNFHDIVAATENFCDSNMLGKGGFGKVYKGMLEGATEVAVKRLGKSSGQGTEEFRNEVALIAKLQHKNLVKLLGCCIYEDEKLLVYEYLPNKSLDKFLFDPARKPMLQWSVRCKIIQGVARGIMYLHQDSRLKIIHRDLKASNILLDMDMCPKISDFGMAKIFCGDQHQANTNRVVGTYGYMSPEYAMEGAFSVKSDTYSFGVLLLEIVSGLKISSPHLIRDFTNLIIYAWKLWKDGKTEDLVDASVKDKCSLYEASRCIHIGLLCVQDSPECRPLMSAVVCMLENKIMPLPVPMQPTMCFAHRDAKPGQASGNKLFSVNEMSLTVLEGR